MTFYSIKYLTTKGIETFTGEVYEGYAVLKGSCKRFEKIGREAFYSRVEAEAAARVAIVKRIASNKKALAKLREIRESLGETK